MNSPIISVVMSVYNADKYLDEAIRSILNQTYKNFEFIIINDGSMDTSLEIIKNYKEQDERIVLVTRENRGLIASLNEGIEKAKGKYIARMDADDISLPNRFEEQVKFMEENLQIGICGSCVEMFGDSVKKKQWKLSISSERLKAELLFSSCFAHPSIMIRRDLLVSNNLFYDKNFLHAEDFELWTRLSSITNFSNLQKVLMKHRILDKSVTRTADMDVEQRYQIISMISRKYLQSLNIQNTEQENKLHFNLSSNIRMKDSNLSFQELKKYFDKLIIANQKSKVFDNVELYKVFGKKWLWNFIYKKDGKAIFSKYFLFGMWNIVDR